MVHRASPERRRASSGRRWRGRASAIVERFARAVVRGKYPIVVAALPDCWRTLKTAGLATGRTRSAVEAQLYARARALGREQRHSWTAEELKVLDRFAARVARGDFPHAEAAVADCLRTLTRAGQPRRHPDSQVGDKLRRRARALGRAAGVVYWRPLEDRLLQRFAKAVIRGRYPHAAAALPGCRQALERIGRAGNRTDEAVVQRLRAHLVTLGRPRIRQRWTPSEIRTVDRFARRIVCGRYRSVQAAVPGCRTTLIRLEGPITRSVEAVFRKLLERSAALGRVVVDMRFSPAEKRVLDQFADAVVRGEYSGAAAALADCREALRRARPSVQRHVVPLAITLRRRIRALGRVLTHDPWTTQEVRIVTRFARLVVRGRYDGAPQVATDCKAALDQSRRRHQGRTPRPPSRSLAKVTGRLWGKLAELGQPRSRGRRTEAEQKVIDRYARAVVEHRYDNVAHAVPDCLRALNRVARRVSGVTDVRSQESVHEAVYKRAREIAHRQLPHRLWTGEERKLTAKWVKKYDRHRRGKLRSNAVTLAEMMRAELARKGYYRSFRACLAELYTQRRRLVWSPGSPATRASSARQRPEEFRGRSLQK